MFEGEKEGRGGRVERREVNIERIEEVDVNERAYK